MIFHASHVELVVETASKLISMDFVDESSSQSNKKSHKTYDHEHNQSSTHQFQTSKGSILDRLDYLTSDYEFNGQSLDYEPNLEFDDTELKEDYEEELDQIAQIRNQHINHLTSQQEQLALQNDCRSSTPSSSDSPQFAVSDLSSSPSSRHGYNYLEPVNELLEENFEEAFKSGLFELNNYQIYNGSGQVMFHDTAASASFFNAARFANRNSSNSADQNDSQLAGKFSKLGLNDAEKEDFSDVAKYGCVEVAGDDLFGRRIITIYACRLPAASCINHAKLLRYLMFTLDKYVENDYCVVYFHNGLNSNNKPKLNFLYQAYKAFDRRYKKNLKALFLVHPTNFIRIVWQLFRPIIR